MEDKKKYIISEAIIVNSTIDDIITGLGNSPIGGFNDKPGFGDPEDVYSIR